jgi:uncharacterized coiled-coil DUF342 family protein
MLKEDIIKNNKELKEKLEVISQENNSLKEEIDELKEELTQVTEDRDFAVKQANQYSALYWARMTDLRILRETLNKLLIADPNIDKKVL